MPEADLILAGKLPEKFLQMHAVPENVGAIDGDHRHFLVVQRKQVRVAVDIHLLILELRVLARFQQDVLGLIAEAASGTGIEGHQRLHYQFRSRRRQYCWRVPMTLINIMPLTNPPTCAKNAVPPSLAMVWPMLPTPLKIWVANQ